MEPDFSYLADELAEQRPDMNIKVTAFTVSEKSINTCYIWLLAKYIQCFLTLCRKTLVCLSLFLVMLDMFLGYAMRIKCLAE